MDKKYTLGIIGAGNMATAILKGILGADNIVNSCRIIVSDIDVEKLIEVSNLNVATTTDNSMLINNSEYIMLAIKPQIYTKISSELSSITDTQHIISIMAGISIETIRQTVGNKVPVCRVMPNTPAMIGQGMSVITFSGYKSKQLIEKIFMSIGEVMEMEESAFNAVTSISGSGPAYVYTFLDALVRGGIDGGLSECDSRKLAIETVIGAANMVRFNCDKPISELIDAVCSKGGTTIEAVNIFKEQGLQDIIVKAIKAARKRSEELSK